jgi:translation machinery-associated protein 16
MPLVPSLTGYMRVYHTVSVMSFFFHAIPDEGVLTLQELHVLVRDLWLTRHDQELEDERAVRRPGRPKSTTEVKLEDIKLRELELYRTGMGTCLSPPPVVPHLIGCFPISAHLEVPDLTHQANVDLFRKWDQKEHTYIHLLRFIRISSVNPTVTVVSRPGKHTSVTAESNATFQVDVDHAHV